MVKHPFFQVTGNIVLTVLVITLLFFGGRQSVLAQTDNGNWKTVAILSLTSSDEGLPILKQFAKSSGHPGLLDDFEVQSREVFNMVDFSKPKGIIVQTNGKSFLAYAFMAIEDVTKLPYGMGNAITDARQNDDGWYKIPINSTSRFLYIKQEKGWAYVSLGPRLPKEFPADPSILLENLNKTYLIGLRFNCGNVPKSLVTGYTIMGKQFLPMIKNLMLFVPQESPEVSKVIGAYFDLLSTIMSGVIDQVATLVNETEVLEYGINVNATSDIIIEGRVVAKPETDMSQMIQQYKNAKTDLIGFYQPGSSIMTVLSAMEMTISQKKYFKTFINGYSKFIDVLFENIPHLGEMSPSAKPMLQSVRTLIKSCTNVANKTIDAGKLDFAESILSEGAVMIAFKTIGAKEIVPALDDIFDKIKIEAKNNGENVIFKSVEDGDFKYWVISIPQISLADLTSTAEIPKINTDSLTYIIGISDTVCVVTYGLPDETKLLAQLKKAIAQSKVPTTAPKQQLVITPYKVGEFVKLYGFAETINDPHVQKMIQMLYDIPKDANIVLTNDVEANTLKQTCVISGKLWPIIGNFGTYIYENFKQNPPIFSAN